MTKLLQLPHTYAHFVHVQNNTSQKHAFPFEDRVHNQVAAFLTLIELVERGDVDVDTSEAGEAPLDEFSVRRVPFGLKRAFRVFEKNRSNDEYYDVDDLESLGEYVLQMKPSRADLGTESMRRFEDAFKGGIDEQTGLFMLEDAFGREYEVNTIEETPWSYLPADRRLMVDELRNSIAIELE